MRICWVVLFLLISQLAFAAGGSGTIGGNITKIKVNMSQQTDFWAAIVGNLNGSPANFSTFISMQSTPDRIVYTNDPNGTYADLYNYTLVLTRLPEKPNISQIFSPVQSDFNGSGMFSNFSIFAGMNFSNNTQSPYLTFVGNWSTTTCYIENVSFLCPYIILQPNIMMAVLAYDNGTSIEPLFIESIISQPGYNGSIFQFEYMVPSLETYYFYVYKKDFPYVKILTPQPITYSSGNLQLTYIMNDTLGIFNCWYVLDGVKTNMPVCGPPYNFTVGPGTHHLFLFANNTIGLISFDSVIFQVSSPTPPTPPKPPQGGGGTHTPYYPQPPYVPPTPPGLNFSIIPRPIMVTIDYPEEGISDFTLTSNLALRNLSCSVIGDFSRYTTVSLDSDSIEANGTISGLVTVHMSPTEILDYNGGMTGTLFCVGMIDSNTTAATAGINLTINKPVLEMENRSFELRAGQELNASSVLENEGNGNATAINISYTAIGNPDFIRIIQTPLRLNNGEIEPILFTIFVPEGTAPGNYTIIMHFFENGRTSAAWVGQITVTVLPPLPITVKACTYPDLTLTLLILLVGMMAEVTAFVKKARHDEKENKEIKKKKGLEKYVGPAAYAFSTMLFSYIIWLIAIWILFRCQ